MISSEGVNTDTILPRTMADLGNNERRMLRAMLRDPNSAWTLPQLLEACDWSDQAHVAGAGLGLEEAGMLVIEEVSSQHITLGEEGIKASEIGLLESRLINWLLEREPKQRTMSNLNGSFEKSEAGPGIGLLKKLGLGLERGLLIVPEDIASIQTILQEREALISQLKEGGLDSISLDRELISLFQSRKKIIEINESTVRTWKLNDTGIKFDTNSLDETQQIVDLTPEMLQTDEWRNAEFKRYDVNLPAPTPAGGRPHPMQSLIQRIRSIFLEMGFSEIEGDFVRTAGWNMDALFIPQTHPARAMQDTFYLEDPQSMPIDEKWLNLWADVHENGGDTGSTGWGGSFNREESQKGLLRTHTTVNTVHHLAQEPDKPCRVFGIGRVFRQEAIDKSHLPEFHQIEGIIHEPEASLPMLVTTLKTFYAKMGYPDVRVRPAYFPYTEPSLEIEVKWRGMWLELGGAGIFRPEVTEPLGTEWPVCAWGMGLERLAMLVLGMDDIRELYQPDLLKLRSMPII
jgi:phenylalanyl-tRNA synthetase alpha chain